MLPEDILIGSYNLYQEKKNLKIIIQKKSSSRFIENDLLGKGTWQPNLFDIRTMAS